MSPAPIVNEGRYRVGAMYGEVYRDGVMLAEVTNITATVERARIDMALAGSTKTGYKFGRETTEGTFTIQKIDSRWEMEVYEQLSATLQQRREARRRGENLFTPFSLDVVLDDPDALGWESWRLGGCLIYRLAVGFDITDDIVTREIPFSFEQLIPLTNFVRSGGTNSTTGQPSVAQTDIRG